MTLVTAKKQNCGWKRARDARTRENRSPFCLRTFASPLEMQQIPFTIITFCNIGLTNQRPLVAKTSLFRDFFPLWGNIFPYTYRDSIQISVPPFYILLSRRKPLQYTIPYATKLIALLSTQAASAEPPSPNEGDR